MAQKRYKEALDAYSKSLSKNPKREPSSSILRFKMAKTLYLMNDVSKAKELLYSKLQLKDRYKCEEIGLKIKIALNDASFTKDIFYAELIEAAAFNKCTVPSDDLDLYYEKLIKIYWPNKRRRGDRNAVIGKIKEEAQDIFSASHYYRLALGDNPLDVEFLQLYTDSIIAIQKVMSDFDRKQKASFYLNVFPTYFTFLSEIYSQKNLDNTFKKELENNFKKLTSFFSETVNKMPIAVFSTVDPQSENNLLVTFGANTPLRIFKLKDEEKSKYIIYNISDNRLGISQTIDESYFVNP